MPEPTRPTWPTVCGTGHRLKHLSASMRPWVWHEARRTAIKLRDEYGTTVGCSGMQLGFDLWWANAIVRAGLTLWAHVPFPQLPDRWSKDDRREYRRLLALAAKVTTYGDRYSVGLLHVRNDGMLSVSDAVVAARRSSVTNGGTVSAMDKAKARRMPMVHLDPDDRTVRLVHHPVIRAEPNPSPLTEKTNV